MNIHVIRRYGGHMHIYITSMVEKLFNVLKIYEDMVSYSLQCDNDMQFLGSSNN